MDILQDFIVSSLEIFKDSSGKLSYNHGGYIKCLKCHLLRNRRETKGSILSFLRYIKEKLQIIKNLNFEVFERSTQKRL